MPSPGQELRVDALTGATVIVAPSRATRPGDAVRFEPVGRSAPASGCPFCAGHEHETPPEVARRGSGAPDTPGWTVRVVPNLYPIVGDGVPGAHEVVVLSPAHDVGLGALDEDTAVAAFTTLRDRAAHHLESGLRHAQAFVNHGRAAGASIAHPHAQLVSVAFVPPRVDALLDRFARGGDLVADACDEVEGTKLVVSDRPTVVWCPSASWSPFLTRCAHVDAGPRFDLAGDEQVADVARAVARTVGAMTRAIGDVAYNVVIESAPAGDPRPFHWWVDVVPRVTVVAGFELGTGLSVNVVLPDAAATALREAW